MRETTRATNRTATVLLSAHEAPINVYIRVELLMYLYATAVGKLDLTSHPEGA